MTIDIKKMVISSCIVVIAATSILNELNLFFVIVKAGEVVFKNDDHHLSSTDEAAVIGGGGKSGLQLISGRRYNGVGSSSSSTNPSMLMINNTRNGKNLLNWINSFTDNNADPYLAKSNAACLEGDLAECFKAKALSSLEDMFGGESYQVNSNARIVRMPDEQLRRLAQESYEFADEVPRTEQPEWDQFVKFLSRKVERFLKSTAMEVHFSDDVTENGRYSPRFIDEIFSELDAIQDKKAGSFTKTKVKKLLIPLLIILKLFKLKLLLFLPLILGLASFKKLLGFLAIVIPGLIGFFKLCKPDLNQGYGNFGHSSYYNRPPHQFASNGAQWNYHRNPEHASAYQYLQENDDSSWTSYSAVQSQPESLSASSIAFKDDAHKLAYRSHEQNE